MSRPSRPSDPQTGKAALRTFFITSRTAFGKAIFQSDRMAALFVDVLRVYVQAGNFKVHDFVVMRDHIHLLITVGGAMSIEKAMQLIKGSFSFRAKKELGFGGEVWQRGFSDVRIKNRASYENHRSYIYDNPVKAGLADRAEDYPYGSLYLRQVKAQGLKPSVKGTSCGTTEVMP